MRTPSFIALTYKGDLPYFISQTKKYLEKLALRRAKSGTHALTAALPEVWTQSSQFFTGIEIAVVQNYLSSLRGAANQPAILPNPSIKWRGL